MILLMWKSPQWHFDVVCVSFGYHFNPMLPKTKYFPVVFLNKWLRFSFSL